MNGSILQWCVCGLRLYRVSTCGLLHAQPPFHLCFLVAVRPAPQHYSESICVSVKLVFALCSLICLCMHNHYLHLPRVSCVLGSVCLSFNALSMCCIYLCSRWRHHSNVWSDRVCQQLEDQCGESLGIHARIHKVPRSEPVY